MVSLIVMSFLIYNTVSSHVIPSVNSHYYSEELVKCVTNIVTKYIAPQKVITYIGNKVEDKEFLKSFHDLNGVAMRTRRFRHKETVLHKSYFISSKECSTFIAQFRKLSKETTWNPNAYFIVTVRILQSKSELKCIFDDLLKLHVTNVIVINATAEAHLYSYNPFDNYGCGNYYENIINHGMCTQMQTQNLFPDKYVNGLQNCTFEVAIPHWPPYTIIPTNYIDNSSRLTYGVEPYLLRLVAEKMNFTFVNTFENISESFSTVSSDMEAEGPLKMLQDRAADIVMGGLILTPSRAHAFDYVFDFLPYVDEVRFIIKRAEFVATWKILYLEFDEVVWILILLSLIIYSLLMIALLQTKDKSLVVLKLLGHLVLNSCNIPCQSEVKWILIIWVWFAYLINTFYHSSLVCLFTNRVTEYQISTEKDILKYKLKPCFSDIMELYYKESQLNDTNVTVPECKGSEGHALTKVNSSEDYYSLTLHGLFKYNAHNFYDLNGNSKVYLLKAPYSKVIYCMYFYKGFPLLHDIHVIALRLREMGLVEKALHDVNYSERIKYRFRGSEKKLILVVPWYIYIFGCIIASFSFVIELCTTRRY